MRVIAVGLGVQGYKRRKFAGDDFVCSVDTANEEADYKDISDVALGDFDAAMCCIPDKPKKEILEYLIQNGKHVLVEKPLWVPKLEDICYLERLAQEKGVVLYTAYNHRFEPHFINMKNLIDEGKLGEIYSCRMFYGNGTARLVRNSAWRDEGAGVLPDLCSHLLDTSCFWFGELEGAFNLRACNRFENLAPDHVVVGSENNKPRLELEMTLLSWRNHFTCDIFAEKGSAHISSLCKWGPSSLTHYSRLFPAGRPPEQTITLAQADPTWELEYAHFRNLCLNNIKTDLSQDRYLHVTLDRLSNLAIQSREN